MATITTVIMTSMSVNPLARRMSPPFLVCEMLRSLRAGRQRRATGGWNAGPNGARRRGARLLVHGRPASEKPWRIMAASAETPRWTAGVAQLVEQLIRNQ